MPGIASQVGRKFLKQKLVYWPKIGSDDAGKPVYGDPVEVKCRWEDRAKEVILPDRRRVFSGAYILVITSMNPGDLVMLATLDQVKALPTWPDPPSSTMGTREVLGRKSTPDIGAKSTIYEVYL